MNKLSLDPGWQRSLSAHDSRQRQYSELDRLFVMVPGDQLLKEESQPAAGGGRRDIMTAT